MRRKSAKTSKAKNITASPEGGEVLNVSGSDHIEVTVQAADETTVSRGDILNDITQKENLSTNLNEDENNEKTPTFHDYDPNYFSPLFLYRPQNDVVGSFIVHSSSEGAGRYELGRKIGINTKSKSGNRRVSQSIQLVTKYFPQHIGQYQKMEGKYRMIKYFLKASKPECHMEVLNRFKELTGRECPFKFGQVLKFPNTKLNTLRITDITMKRILHIIHALKETPIILTSIKLVRYIQEKDAKEGYPFRIDKKSAAKCLLALKQHGFCRLFDTEYEDEGVKRPLEIVTSMDYTSVDHPDICKAIAIAASEYAKQNKIFPSGTPRPWKKTPAIVTNQTGLEMEEEENEESVKQQEDVKHITHLKEVLKTKNEVPLVSEKTLNSLTINYRRRKGLVASIKKNKKNNLPSAPTTDNSMEQLSMEMTPSTSSAGGNILAADQDLAAVMDSSSLATIKDELVNALTGFNTNVSSSEATDGTPVKRRRKRKTNTESIDTTEDTPKKKKRQLDDVDINCLNQQVYMRNRFTPKERDMLILIRAVGFFLNPIHRFWLDPTIMRDIMHEYVPESRCKTASSLLAAGSRDLARNDRMSHLQYIVKTLSSYEEMRELRNRLPTLSMDNVEAKNALFIEAFTLAHELLFKDSQTFPSVRDTDSDFEEYISSHNLHIVSNAHDGLQDETILSIKDFPRRSVNPSVEEDAKHCVNFNVIMSILLNDDKNKPSFLNDPVMKTVGSEALEEGLEQLHRDGLVTKVRYAERQANIASEGAPDPSDPVRMLRNQINLSVFYRHFFFHSYHNDVINMTKAANERFKADLIDETDRSDPGSIVLLSRCFISDDYDIDVTVPESLDSLFSNAEDKDDKPPNATKRMRELEDADLHIDLIRIIPTGIRPTKVATDAMTAIESLTHRVPIDEIELAKSRDCSTSVERLSGVNGADAVLVYRAIESSAVRGSSEEELVMNTGLDAMQLKKIINVLTDSYDIFPCGVDKRRYVLMRNADCWMVRNKKFGFYPRPWTMPSGENNLAIFRWMAESILVLIHKKPGITIQELISTYAFAIQPIIVEEILCLLETIDASHIHVRSMMSLVKTSDGRRAQCTVRYAMPVHDGLEKFAECFKDIQ